MLPSSPVPCDRLCPQVPPLAACFVMLTRTVTGLEAIERWPQRSPGCCHCRPVSLLPQLAGGQRPPGHGTLVGLGTAALCKMSLWVGDSAELLRDVTGAAAKHKRNPEAAGALGKPVQPFWWPWGGWVTCACPQLLPGPLCWCVDGSAREFLGGNLELHPEQETGRCFLTTRYQSWFFHPPLPGQSLCGKCWGRQEGPRKAIEPVVGVGCCRVEVWTGPSEPVTVVTQGRLLGDP